MRGVREELKSDHCALHVDSMLGPTWAEPIVLDSQARKIGTRYSFSWTGARCRLPRMRRWVSCDASMRTATHRSNS
eukprot:10104665-Karenia_brevis.AAC.1